MNNGMDCVCLYYAYLDTRVAFNRVFLTCILCFDHLSCTFNGLMAMDASHTSLHRTFSSHNGVPELSSRLPLLNASQEEGPRLPNTALTCVPCRLLPSVQLLSFEMSTQSQPHPRAALRNRNLPKLPDFEFPARAPSPQPPPSSQPRRAAPPPPRTPNQQSSSPILTPQFTSTQTEAQLNSEIKAEKDRQLFRAKGASSQAKGTAGSERVVERFEGKDKDMAISDMSKKGQWIFYAVTSGACAAVNGVFAKL